MYTNFDIEWSVCATAESLLQLDMEVEARNLSKFNGLMQGYDNVKFPTPLYPFVTKTVLVESYEVYTKTPLYNVCTYSNNDVYKAV